MTKNLMVSHVDISQKNQLVVKSNQLIEASYRLTTQEQRIVLLMASMILPEDEDFKLYSIDVDRFMELIGVIGHSKYAEVKDITRSLREKTLIIRDNNSELQVGWLSSAEYFDGKGYVELEFSPKLKPYLLQLKERFTQYQLKNVIRLTRSYSVRIYELFKQYEKIGERYFTIEEFKQILWIKDEEYKLYGHLKNRVIKPAQKELAEKTDLKFELKEEKKGRKVVGLKFKIFKNRTEEDRTTEILGNEVKNIKLYQRLKDYFCLSSSQALHVLNTVDEKRIIENLAYVESQIKRGKVGNIGSYTLTAIEKDFRIQQSLFEIEKVQAQEKQKLALDLEEAGARKAEEFRQEEVRRIEEIYQNLSEEERVCMDKEVVRLVKNEVKGFVLEETSPAYEALIRLQRAKMIQEKYL